ncbi:MAG: AAA family ATPase [Bryobacteraceae bacterium]
MLKKFKMPIGRMFQFLGKDNNIYNIELETERKIFIKTIDNKFVKINYLIKKLGNIYSYNYEGGNIICDENHLVKSETGEFKFIKDLTYLQTIHGLKRILYKEFKKIGDVYDISIDNPHEYITSKGVICHNTTVAKILASNISSEVLFINASDERNISLVRDRIKGFAETQSMDFSSKKIIILDEADGITTLAQEALRPLIEQYSANLRIIMTCNNLHKLITPIISRFQLFEFHSITKEQTINYIKEKILKKENIEFKNEDLEQLYKISHGDLRKMINSLQKSIIQGKLVIVDKDIVNGFMEVFKERNISNLKKFLSENDVDYLQLYRYLYDKAKNERVIQTIADFLYKDYYCIDKEINFTSCIISLWSI